MNNQCSDELEDVIDDEKDSDEMEGGEESDDHDEYNCCLLQIQQLLHFFLNLTLIINLPFSRNFDISQWSYTLPALIDRHLQQGDQH